MNASLEIQRIVIETLKEAAPVVAIIGDRCYDFAPANVTFPYAKLSGWQVIQDDADCLEGEEIFFDIQCFSSGKHPRGRVEVGQLASAIKDALHDKHFPMPAHDLVLLEHRNTTYFLEPDGISQRAVLNFRVLVDRD